MQPEDRALSYVLPNAVYDVWLGSVGVKEKSADGIGHEVFVPLLELRVDRQDGWKQTRAK